ncbi:DUF982 domain-containing protein [Mesorhizobium sp. ES1-1]|uniref:DUF982 domain-containing protein n=1 Tax=Mesorhizobium sp. ES1-1 TaxID=2876629 RepID=UPI001CCF8AC9|nr:DUF982 domain-containing protein [Mesorhizobium sp. ES1-1]MBZ9677719.1 DUF982 domain-containing protein [Mesorhizobium sp. ES1-1]
MSRLGRRSSTPVARKHRRRTRRTSYSASCLREEATDRLHFFCPTRISHRDGHPVEEIGSVGQAITFLNAWPAGRRGPVYQCAVNCCSAALSGQMAASAARKAFTGFARITRLLDEDLARPVRGEVAASVQALRH